ncbi:7 transmembrane receptor (rhodopsin family) domain-containing protein [Ditylenchus destructor]|uniref:7 transmembrane receptor (Rhodopsin family) domain-containing protein n=1 Tax=Ditylenchus destructor TaxID=166010 RepID=A0AAD4RCV9_9BILA|nr:7 transmembrane receptor (rhodopsin family) domain-containing protein [Ditylenchus destructor]
MNLEECEITERGTYRCSSSGQEFFVRNVYPPIQELQPRVLIVVIIFVLCFIVGICGNSSILTIIRGIISERKSLRTPHRRSSDNAILYIAALCVVDFLMSLSLPPAILDSIIGFWMFGTAICKLHHVCGSVGRIVSTFLITAMSFDRFVAVCHPYKAYYRSRKFVISTIITLWTIAFILLLPMLTYAKANEVLLHQIKQPGGSGFENITRVRVYKCSDMMPPSVFYWFTCSTFILGYLVPLVLIVFFNSRLIRKLYRHTKVIPRSGIPLRRISIYTILIAVLYFVCWTPYWCSVLYAIYMSVMSSGGSQSSELLLFIIYCVHLLPYFGSASNWILYGLLNTQLQMKHESPAGGAYVGQTDDYGHGTTTMVAIMSSNLNNGIGGNSACVTTGLINNDHGPKPDHIVFENTTLHSQNGVDLKNDTGVHGPINHSAIMDICEGDQRL